MNSPDLSRPRLIVVQGGTGAIGASTAKLFEERGDVVFPLGRADADVRDPEQVRRVVDDVVARHGDLDVLVTCAGINRAADLFASSDSGWQDEIDTNLGGTIAAVRAVANSLRDGGSIVMVGSVMSMHPSRSLGYVASKGGIHALTMTLAWQLAPRQIRVNTVAPGFVRTRMLDALDETEIERRASCTLVRRLAEPVEIARVIWFLASPDASYVTGHVLVADGGFQGYPRDFMPCS